MPIEGSFGLTAILETAGCVVFKPGMTTYSTLLINILQ